MGVLQEKVTQGIIN